MSFKYLEQAVTGISCPFCGASNGRRLFAVTADQAVAHFLPPFVPQDTKSGLRKHLNRLWGSDTCSVVRCCDCSGCFSQPFVAGDSDFYRLAYAFNYGYTQDRWEFDRAMQRLGRSISRPAVRVLEIGAGDGAFMKRLMAAGVRPENISCIEFSDAGRRRILELSPKVNVFTDAGDLFESPELQGGHFDAIVAFQVMEHLGEPTRYLKQLAGMLARDGCIFASVPNPRRIEFNELNGALLDMPPNHILRFSKEGIQALAQRAALVVEEIEDEPFEFTAALQQFLIYRYKRRSQDPRTIEYTLASLTANRLVRKTLAAAVIGLSLPRAISKFFGRTDGGTRFMVFRGPLNAPGGQA
jgi:2-polyprenyl-3-methyl-5-hydroxy-6-metoxy-1,4-benzoquinol methylase